MYMQHMLYVILYVNYFHEFNKVITAQTIYKYVVTININIMSSQTNTDEIDIDIAFESLYQQIDSEPNLINVEDKLTKYMLSPKHNQYIIDIFTRFNKIITPT